MSAAEQRLTELKELNRARQKRYYDEHKETIKTQKKARRAEISRLLAQLPAAPPPPPAPIAAPAPVVAKNNNDILRIMDTTNYYENQRSRTTDKSNFKIVLRAIDNADFITALEHPQQLIQKVKAVKQSTPAHKGEPYALSAFQKMGSAMLNVIKFCNIKITKEQDKQIFNFFKTSKLNYEIEQFKNKTNLSKRATVKRYEKILERALTKYGKTSEQYLIAVLYKYAPIRNEYKEIILTKGTADVVEKHNYIILPATGDATLYLDKFKTRKKHETIIYKFPAEATTLLRAYIKRQKVPYGNKLFSNLSGILVDITEDQTNNAADGGARVLRRSAASTLYDDYKKNKATIDQIYDQIQLMAHASDTHLKDYIYKVN
jgi:hypothetical protein